MEKDINYPELTEQGKTEARNLVKKIVKDIKKELDGNDFYCEIPCYIESDSWKNFRNSLLDGLKDYSNAKLMYKYDFKKIREVMLRDYRDEIVNDLNQDHLIEIKVLKERIKTLEEIHRYYLLPCNRVGDWEMIELKVMAER